MRALQEVGRCGSGAFLIKLHLIWRNESGVLYLDTGLLEPQWEGYHGIGNKIGIDCGQVNQQIFGPAG
jgi:hypothetical protein